MSGPALSVVFVDWNGGEEIVRNVGAVAALARRRGDVEVIVVDNASTDGSPDALRKLDGVRVIGNAVNEGFGPGCNRGAAAASAPLVLFLNPDATPKEGDDPFAPLLAAASAAPEVAGFAPRLEDPPAAGHREPQERFQFRRLPTPGSLARELLLVDRLLPRSAALRHSRYLDVDRSAPFDVEQPAAAALLLRMSVFDRLGGFDPRFVPAWWEDVDLAARLAAAGQLLRTVPEARFVHRGGSAVSDEPGRLSEAEYRRIFGRNLLRYAEKHWGASSVPLVRLLLFGAGLLRLLILPLPGPPRRRRASSALGTLGSAFLSTRRVVSPGSGA